MTKFGHLQTRHCFLPSKTPQLWQMMSLQQLLCGIQLSHYQTISQRARTGNNLKLSNMGNSPWAFRWHLLSMMHMSCTLLMISCCSHPQKMSKWSHLRPWSLSSIINRCFNMPGWFFWFSHLQMVNSTFDESHLEWLKHAHVPLCMGLSFGVQKEMSHEWATKADEKLSLCFAQGGRKLPNFAGKQKTANTGNHQEIIGVGKSKVTKASDSMFFGDTCSSSAVLQSLKAENPEFSLAHHWLRLQCFALPETRASGSFQFVLMTV